MVQKNLRSLILNYIIQSLDKGIEIMYAPEDFVETIQNTKKQFFTAVITDNKVRSSFIDMIDAQTAFYKAAIRNTEHVSDFIKKNFVITK